MQSWISFVKIIRRRNLVFYLKKLIIFLRNNYLTLDNIPIINREHKLSKSKIYNLNFMNKPLSSRIEDLFDALLRRICCGEFDLKVSEGESRPGDATHLAALRKRRHQQTLAALVKSGVEK